jgi:hypothetical protein
MNEPTRMRQESGSALEHALLNAGASTASSAETRAKTLAALGLAGSVTLLAGTAGAASLSSLAKLGWTKVLLGVSLVGAATAVPVGLYVARHGRETPAVATTVVGASRRAPLRAPELEATAVPEAPVVVAHPARTATRRLTPRGRLSHELAALDAARSRLADGDARSALALLDIYSDTFPNGHLELEAEVLRIDALAKSGRKDAARQHAEAFLRRHPQSVLASRVRADARPDE